MAWTAGGDDVEKRDVEKRWTDPPGLRQDLRYAAFVVVVPLTVIALPALWAYLARSDAYWHD